MHYSLFIILKLCSSQWNIIILHMLYTTYSTKPSIIEEVIYLCINYTANSDVSILNKVVKEKNIINYMLYSIS